MKHLKRWLALAVSAALALTLLAGCHTGGISSRLLLDLLAGELENVQVETDSTFDRALKAAVQKSGSDPDAVLNALIDELNISGGTVNFSISGIGNASAGRQSLNVVFQPGSNPNTAANNAASGWLGVLRGLSGSGEYSGLVSMVEVNGGYILAISVMVEQPGNIGSDDDDDDNEPTPDPIPEGGYKVINKVYHVYNEEGLKAWAKEAASNLSLSCTLERDIILSSASAGQSNWTPIGNFSNRYTGTFDGNHCTITGLIISSSGDYVGLFGSIGSGGVVKNLTLQNVNISGYTYVGGIAGANHGTITNCKVEGGSVSGSDIVGGVAGVNDNGITGCKVEDVTVKGSGGAVGGVVGYNSDIITACYHAGGSVSGDHFVGGMVGWNVSGSVTACYHANGTVSGSSYVGGVVGRNVSGTITACYWSGYDGPGIGSGGGDATKVDGTVVTWKTAYNAMDSAAPGYYQYIDETTPPTLKQK